MRKLPDAFVTGVHTNMCILNRTFAIKQMTRCGTPCLLVLDMTGSMDDPQDSPFVAEEKPGVLCLQQRSVELN